MAICPHCHREVPDDALICPYCGAQLREDIAVCENCGSIIPADAKVCPVCGVELSDTVKCPNCGREIPANSKSCPYCGFAFDKDENVNKIEYEPMIIPRGEPREIKEKTATELTPPPAPPKSKFWKGFAAGFIVALLVTSAALGIFYISPLQNENADLRSKLMSLQNNYTALSLRYNSLVLNYSSLNQSYLMQVQQYNALLANYTALYGEYENLTDFSNEKFIVLLFFTTDYGNNKYWLYLEIDPQLYLEYKEKPHLPGTSQYMEEFKDYVVTDSVMRTIVNSVKSKLTTSSDEEFADALLSLVQNKIVDGSNGDVYNNGDNLPGTYYYADTPAKYPVETLVLHSGECLDDSIFYLSLLKTAGFHSGFLFIPNEAPGQGHVMGIVNLTSGKPTHAKGTIYSIPINGVVYYPAETTAYGAMVGESAINLTATQTYAVLVN